MVEQLAQTGNISREKAVVNRMNWYDDLLLYILQHHPERSRRIFSALFNSQPFARIMKFLDQDTHLGEDALIFKDLPIAYFLEAAMQHFWASKWKPVPKAVVHYPSK